MANRQNANGMGSTTKLKNGRYKHSISVGFTPKGKVKRISATDSTKLGAIRKAEEKAENYKKEKMLNKSAITFGQLAEKCIEDMLRTGKIRESTYIRKLETLKRLKPLFEIPISDMSEDDLDEFFNKEIESKISDSTISKDIALIRATFELAVRRKIISSSDNFTQNYRKPKSTQEKQNVRALTCEEQKAFVKALKESDTPYKEVMFLILMTGLRPGEALALNVEDVDLEAHKLYVTKTLSQNKDNQSVITKSTKTKAGRRMVTLTDAPVKLLEKVIGKRKSGLLFSDENGKPIKLGLVRYQFNKVISNNRIADLSVDGRIDLHSLRHTYATRCFEAGVNPLHVQKQLGHKNIQTTLDTYTSVFDQDVLEGIQGVDDYIKIEDE